MRDIASIKPNSVAATAAPEPAAPTHPAHSAVPASQPPERASGTSRLTPQALQAELDRALENADTSLRFRVDAQTRRIVVSVLDGRGEVLLQIPDETALAVARRLAATGSLLDLKA